jgi:hypothetical protein
MMHMRGRRATTDKQKRSWRDSGRDKFRRKAKTHNVAPDVMT